MSQSSEKLCIETWNMWNAGKQDRQVRPRRQDAGLGRINMDQHGSWTSYARIDNPKSRVSEFWREILETWFRKWKFKRLVQFGHMSF